MVKSGFKVRGEAVGCVKMGRKFRGGREMEVHKLDGRRRRD